jgi:ATP-dependent Clp endopeptidase proteolytic subunit ClpP
MKEYFNIVRRADGTSCIFLYGDIGAEVQCGRVAAELMEAESQSRRIEVRINSNGGDVYSGIGIFNAIRNTKGDVKLYVDGVAASMAGVIALCGKPVEMSRYARLMLHSVSGGCYGNKVEMQKCIEEIEGLEKTLSEICATKLRMTAEAVRAQYFDTEDHWLTAEEALALGFIDGIYDAEEVPAGSTPQEIYAIYNNRLETAAITNRLETATNRQNKMDLEELKKRARFKDCASDAEASQRLDTLEQEAAGAADLARENESLKGQVAKLEAAEASRAEAARKALLDQAERDGRIDATNRSVFEAMLQENPERGAQVLQLMQPKRSVMQDLHQQPTADAGPWQKRMAELRAKRQ